MARAVSPECRATAAAARSAQAVGEGKPHGRCRDLGKTGCALGLAAAIQRQPTPREQLEAVRPPAAGDERQLLTTGAAEEQLDGSVWLPGFEQDAGEPHRSPGRDEAIVEVARELDALLCGGEREVEIADGDCDDGAVEEVPGESRRGPEQAPGLDGAVQEFGGLGQLAAHVPDPGQDQVQAEEGIPSPRRASEPEGTARVRVGLGVEVEVELSRSEPGRRVGAERELVVGQPIDQRCGFGTVGSSCLGRSGHGVRERGHGERRRQQGRISQYLRRAHRAPGPVVHRLVSRAVELVQRQLDQQPDGLDRGRLRQAAKSPHETRVGLLVSPEEALHPGARRRDCRAEGARLLRDDRDRLQQRLMAVGEMPRRRQRPGTGEQKLDALLRRRGLREQPQRRAEPPRGAFGREPCRCLAGLAQDGDGGDVALARRPLDVVGARRCRHSPRRERLGAPLVGPEPPAAGSGLVHRAPDERVSEAEASRHVGGANEIELQELVDCVHRRRLRGRGRGGRQFGLEWIARHRRSFEHEASAVRQQRELLAQRGGDRWWDLEAGQ